LTSVTLELGGKSPGHHRCQRRSRQLPRNTSSGARR
jgi:hypothetical protein